MHKLLHVCLLGLVSATAGASAQSPAVSGSPDLSCDAAGAPVRVDPQTRAVLRALTRADGARQQTALLESYLARADGPASSARLVATNHARLVLAAERIRRGKYDEARQALAQVDLASPVAVDAALLLAESYRLQGNDAQARAWLVRVAQRYSSDPDALTGLLSSAHDMAASGKVREAWALYGLISEKVLANVEQMGAMRNQSSALVNQLLSTRLDESRSVAAQLLKTILHSPGQAALSSMRNMLEAQRRLECLTRKEESLKDDAWNESIQHANVTSFQTMLETEARINAHQLDALERKLAAASEREKPVIEEEIAVLREQMASLDERLAELKARQAELPAASLDQQKELESRIAGARAVVEENRLAIRAELDRTLAALQKRYRELAAETQLAQAELMQVLARR